MRVEQQQDAPALIGARTAWRIAAALFAGAAGILWLGSATDIDLMLADAVYDAGLRDFPWRHAWLTETFSHGILKTAFTLAAVGCILAALHDMVRPHPGRAPYLRLFDALPFGVQPGHCLPAGHASSALCAGLAALAFGGAVGWLQQLRGAHFLMHTLWSVWIACAVVAVVVACVQWGSGY